MERLILIGNPDNRRTAGLQEARRQLGLEPAYVVPYAGLLQGTASLAEAARQLDLPAGIAPMLRIDAPGEDFQVERLLIALGAPDARAEHRDERLLAYGAIPDPQPLGEQDARSLREQTGRLYHPSQWFRGFMRLLGRLEREAEALWPSPFWVNAPPDIAAMFDKRVTHRILSGAGVPVPRLLAAPAELPDYEALREVMLKKGMHRVFVKLASGSGACGVVAYQLNPRTGAEVAVTTLGVEQHLTRPPVYYNAIKPHRYTEQKTIRQLLSWLLAHGAHAEQWVAKATFQGRAFDVRQLVVDGQACHSIARLSKTPITNLHLKSERMSLEEIGLSEETRQAVGECAERALSAFPRSLVAGVDVLLRNGICTPVVGELNPFGDLLYRVDHQGYGTYAWEMKRLPDFRSWRERGLAGGIAK
ncbi:STM4014 family protein [Paenibacillus sp. YN15]|uniref:STM4014 family protein n=1 Tax=Paenibacillus sp. YN15 TaxID=1742774 RepID=UPI000DCDB344|nr:STM4014 family protein [Paenibacillus sp. YN15]RAU99876.1 hypothetical protein DQG13_15385 [Paenibacillus sp. YN15]